MLATTQQPEHPGSFVSISRFAQYSAIDDYHRVSANRDEPWIMRRDSARLFAGESLRMSARGFAWARRLVDVRRANLVCDADQV